MRVERAGRTRQLRVAQVKGNSRDAVILALNPRGFWKLTEGSGATAIDSSGNGLNGSISSASWGVATGPDGLPALYFDGINSAVTVAETAILQPTTAVSVSLWAKAETGAGCVMSMDDGSWSYGYGHFAFPAFQVQNGGSVSTGGTFTVDVWQHWLWTFTASTGTAKAYRNGIEIASTTGSAGNIVYVAGLQLRIGLRVGHSVFKGAIQRMAIYGTALSAADAVALAA